MTDKRDIAVDALEFREITVPVSVALAKRLADAEAVHPIDARRLGKNRIAPSSLEFCDWGGYEEETDIGDKHAYGLFLPGHDFPEIVVYVKLMHRKTDETGFVPNSNLTGNILPILVEDCKSIESPNTAIFYTITNMGFNNPLYPISLKPSGDGLKPGESLIRQTAAHLQKTYGISTLTTLSPLRQGKEGFAQWLEGALSHTQALPMLSCDEIFQINTIASRISEDCCWTLYEKIKYIHQSYSRLDLKDQKFFAQCMCDLGVYYLAEAKTTIKSEKLPLDTVARFHLSNGAELANIHYHPPEKTTEKESDLALGLMVNYRYDPEMLDYKKSICKTGRVVMDEAMYVRHSDRLEQFRTPGYSVSGFQLSPFIVGNSRGII